VLPARSGSVLTPASGTGVGLALPKMEMTGVRLGAALLPAPSCPVFELEGSWVSCVPPGRDDEEEPGMGVDAGAVGCAAGTGLAPGRGVGAISRTDTLRSLVFPARSLTFRVRECESAPSPLPFHG